MKLYEVVADLQGGDFAMNRQYTIEQWREQAIDWLRQDDADEIAIRFFESLPEKEVLREIMEWWQLDIRDVEDDSR